MEKAPTVLLPVGTLRKTSTAAWYHLGVLCGGLICSSVTKMKAAILQLLQNYTDVDTPFGHFDKITALCAETRRIILGYEVAHVGINTASDGDAQAVAGIFGGAFGFPVKNGGSSVFASTGIEIMKSRYLGGQGHIAVRTNRIGIAIADLEKKGFAVDMSTAKYKDGKLAAVYLENEIGGFAVHLLQK